MQQNTSSISGHGDENYQPPNQQISSYSAAVNQQQFPTKKQAVIFDSHDELTVYDYTKAVGNVIGPKNIRYVSKISKNRICMYLSNSELVDKVISEKKVFQIKDQTLQARRLVSPSIRLVLSNVSPTIPHSTIENELKKLNIKLLSPIIFLRMNLPDPEYSHIFSFRRHTYIDPQCIDSLPDSIIITDENTEYRIFLSVDDETCFKCKKQVTLLPNAPNK